MSIETLHTDHAPKAIGPYAQAVKANGFLFTAGQIPLHPVSMEIVEGDVAAQTEQVLANLQAVLTEAGVTWNDVVKTTCFLRTMDDFAAFNGVYSRVLGDARPARSTGGRRRAASAT
ncbi:Rid family detoxifying hydrolase [Gemmatimonas sp.]|uniref:Rid family detoxifying hydrolase n=1 Tax=Gemmatimonas sp. TaxID=1962908 RepID=UPI003DA52A43